MFSPEQIEGNWVNVGVTFGLTSTLIEASTAHWPTAGVNVYEVVAVLLIAGDHDPEIPSIEVKGKLKEPPEHIGEICAKLGITGEPTFTIIFASDAHWPELGVKV